MPQVPGVKSVTLEGDYYHVRFRDPDEFSDIRTPEWAATAAGDVSEGSKVRMGNRTGDDEWVVQSVLVEKHVGESKAQEQAEKIIEKLED